jgi:PAS domain S-box-containing protein
VAGDASSPATDRGCRAALWLIFDHARDAVAVLDDKRRFVAINPQAQRLLGCSEEDVRGRSIVENVLAAEREKSASGWQTLLRDGSHQGTRALIRGDGREIVVRFVGGLFVLDDQQLAVYLATPERPELRLTARESEVVELVACGYGTRRIAELLILSPATVRAHVRNAMAKAGARTRAQLVAIVLDGHRGLDIVRR